MSLSHTHAVTLAHRPHRVCRRSLAVCLQPHLIGERLISVAAYGTVSQNMLYRMDGRVQFLLPILDRLAHTCSRASTAPSPVGTEGVYAGVKGARPWSWRYPSHVSVLPHSVLLRQRNKPNVPDAILSMAVDYKLLYRSAPLNKHDFMAVLPSSVLVIILLIFIFIFVRSVHWCRLLSEDIPNIFSCNCQEREEPERGKEKRGRGGKGEWKKGVIFPIRYSTVTSLDIVCNEDPPLCGCQAKLQNVGSWPPPPRLAETTQIHHLPYEQETEERPCSWDS